MLEHWFVIGAAVFMGSALLAAFARLLIYDFGHDPVDPEGELKAPYETPEDLERRLAGHP